MITSSWCWTFAANIQGGELAGETPADDNAGVVPHVDKSLRSGPSLDIELAGGGRGQAVEERSVTASRAGS
jgi:hypothetical protein